MKTMNTETTISNDQFQEMLERIVGEHSPSALLSIPGVHEVLSEHFNNEVIERLEKQKEYDVTPRDRGARITFAETRGYGSKRYLHVRIEIPNGEEIGDEYELNFEPSQSPAVVGKSLDTPLRNWRAI